MHGISNRDLFLDQPNAQQLNSLSEDNNRSAARWAHHRWKVEWLDNITRLRTFIPDIGTHPSWNGRTKNSLGPDYDLFCGL